MTFTFDRETWFKVTAYALPKSSVSVKNEPDYYRYICSDMVLYDIDPSTGKYIQGHCTRFDWTEEREHVI